MQKRFFVTGCLLLSLAVALGALGAHALKSVLSDEALKSWHTAVNYQFFHGLALLITALLMWKVNNKLIRSAGLLFIGGILCFSGSIYILLFLPDGNFLRSVFGPITPLGGIQFMAGWLCLLFGIARIKTWPASAE